jgi:two-component system chemotaxis response regulator CheY
MLVEDNPIMRSALHDLLQLSGYTVVTASHGREALERLADAPVDLIVTDYLMPEMNGVAFLESLRGDARYQKSPVIMFTASNDPAVQDAVADAGADAFLMRPVTIEALLTLVQQCLNGVASPAG